MSRNYHKGLKYQCLECKKQFSNKENCALHQKTTGHKGEGIIEKMLEANEEEIDEISKVSENLNSEEQCAEQSSPEKLAPIASEEENYEEMVKVDDSMEISDYDESKPTEVPETEISAQEEDQKAKCEACDKDFSSAENFETHLKSVHSGSHVCTVCNKRLANQASLREHSLTHEVKQIP